MKLSIATESGDRESPHGQAVKRISDIVAEQSDGRISMNVFYQGELGGPQELFDQLARGNIDLFLGWPQTSYDERLGVLTLPYLTLGWEEALEAYGKDGWISEVINPILSDMGLEYLGPFPEGFGGIATAKSYATNFEDARGIKLRSQPIFPLPQTIQAMGFQAVPIDWSEVYTSIQTGVVDGDSSNVIYWDYTYFNDLLDYFVHSKHNFSFYTFLMNQNSWDALDDEDRKIIADAVEVVINQQFENARAEDEKWIQKAQEDGMEYIVPTDEEMSAWVERVRRDVWVQAEQSLGEDIMTAVRANASVPK
ncbi:TRAP transporter substrate-binding protein DctP [Nitrincola sp. MINF-07-Sa-05]|uniref:TRAP transporter substrate-binding protein DctP n=1 Tax=Nitrincola salilacus TaxID=3400273 RepID=UPI0039182114